MSTNPWYCGSCQKKNSYRAEYCDQCGTAWSWSTRNSAQWGGGQWQDPATPKRRSQSRQRSKGNKGKGKGKSKDSEYGGQQDHTPWQSSSSAMQSLGVNLPEMEQKTVANVPSKQAEGVISGLRAHLKSLGQEASPEVESYLAKCLGNGPQVIKQASQRLEASGKTSAKLKVEIAQLSASWQRFQKKLEEEYQTQKQKFMEKQKQLQDGLAKAEEEYAAAKEARRAAATLSNPGQEGEMGIAPKHAETPPAVTPPPEAAPLEGTPQKRKPEVVEVEDDPVLKRIRSPIIVDSPGGGMNKMDF